ncbi:MAG TPA: Lrp/AsnC family transcriptional regulator, partial [Rhizomicrobium sp.]|nr:Lrp/AsnC family transcriptional regulator [Rhizomicrobium sp.]
MEHHKLDSIDMRILSELQDDGRITNVELSRRAKITAPPCLRRMRALEKSGYIKGYHADLDPKMLGYEVTGFVFVGLSSQADADLKKFEEQVR